MNRRADSLQIILTCLLILFGGVPSTVLAGSNKDIVYQGRIQRPDGTLINSGTLTFTLSVYSPLPRRCLLYSETQNVEMTGSHGLFSLHLGAGTRSDSGSHSFNQVFVNGLSLSSLVCSSGTSYASTADEDRDLIVSFNDSGTIVQLAAMAIKSVPFALQAHEIDGWGLNNLVKVSSSGSPTTFTLSEMANVKTVGAANCSSGEVLKWNSSAWMCGADATGGAPGDAGYTGTKGIVAFDTDAATSGISISSGVASVNAGTGANQIVKLDSSSKLPAVDGSALTNLRMTQIASGTLPISQGGTGQSTKTAAFDALSPNTTKGDLTVRDSSGNIRLPVGSDGQVLTADAASAAGVKWSNITAGTVTSVTGGAGLLGGTITSAGTLSVDVGTGANQIVQLDASSKMPAVDGSNLKNLSTAQFTSGILSISRGGTGTSSLSGSRLVATNVTGTALQSVNCSLNQVLSFDASGYYGCYNLSSLVGGTYFSNGGNAFGADAVLGTTDNQALKLMTNNSHRMIIDTAGNVGIGTLSPTNPLSVDGNANVTGNLAVDGEIEVSGSSISFNGVQFLFTDSLGVNVALGSAAGGDSGLYNTTVGHVSGLALDGSTMNTTAIGAMAGLRVTGSSNTFVGSNAAGQNISTGTGQQNSSIGAYSLFRLTNGSNNVAVGRAAGYSITNGAGNTVLGPRAGYSLTTGNYNVVIGGNDGSSIAALSNHMIFSEGSGTERMRIDNTGNVGIGTTSPGAKLDVVGTVSMSSSVEGVSSYVNTGTAYAIPGTSVNIVRLTLDNDATITLPSFTATTGKVFTLTVFLKQDATGSRAVSFSGASSDVVKWDLGAAPAISSTAGKVTILQFTKPSDEAVWYASMVWKEN